ncbi:MAG: ArsR/SmtB family transcription factor [Fibrobacterota bacterium]
MDNEKLYQAKAEVLRALGHPTRLFIAEKLRSGEKCVCEIAKGIDADLSTVSKHLSVLKYAGIIEDRREGKSIYYRLKVPCVLEFTDCVESVLRSKAKACAVSI